MNLFKQALKYVMGKLEADTLQWNLFRQEMKAVSLHIMSYILTKGALIQNGMDSIS